jgi:hypothetical protein
MSDEIYYKFQNQNFKLYTLLIKEFRIQLGKELYNKVANEVDIQIGGQFWNQFHNQIMIQIEEECNDFIRTTA